MNTNATEINIEWVKAHFPLRQADSHKGIFGTVALSVGSNLYRGAAHLALGAALRSGVGYTRFVGDGELARELRMKYPEAIYHTEADTEKRIEQLCNRDSVVIGSGSGISESLCSLTRETVKASKGRVVVDADAINSVARYSSPTDLSTNGRRVILTPHLGEFSRISGLSVDEISADRISAAVSFARKYQLTLLLKGSGTLITDGERTLVNTTGSPALSKGGSGDVLAGLIGGLSAYVTDPLIAAALGAYLHGAAADRLTEEYSTLGVIPSDLPVAIARVMAEIEREISPRYYKN